MSISIKIQKKDLWLIAAIMVFLIGVGYVVAWGSGNPSVMGHSIDEISGYPFAVKEPFYPVHTYPYEPATYPDPYLRDNSHPYPYLTIGNAIAKFGKVDAYSTNWFVIGFNYYQPWAQEKAAIYLEAGQSHGPFDTYHTISFPAPNYGRKNLNDPFYICAYFDNNDVRRLHNSKIYCTNCIDHPGTSNCKRVDNMMYFDSASNLNGVITIETRLKAAWQPEKCTKIYRTITLGQCQCDAKVSQVFYGDFVLPDTTGDICYGANIHSVIEARYVIKKSPSMSSADSSSYNIDPIDNFKTKGATMIKEVGILRVIQEA